MMQQKQKQINCIILTSKGSFENVDETYLLPPVTLHIRFNSCSSPLHSTPCNPSSIALLSLNPNLKRMRLFEEEIVLPMLVTWKSTLYDGAVDPHDLEAFIVGVSVSDMI